MWPENWRILEVFLRATTQWVFAGMSGVVVGLNYASVQTIIYYSKIPAQDHAKSFLAIQEMERAAMKILNAKQNSQPKPPQPRGR